LSGLCDSLLAKQALGPIPPDGRTVDDTVMPEFGDLRDQPKGATSDLLLQCDTHVDSLFARAAITTAPAAGPNVAFSSEPADGVATTPRACDCSVPRG
jgi:hypothetical protein